jgi:hypothetical protein
MILRKSYPEIKDLIIAAQTETNELISIFVKSIQTAKANLKKK